MKRILLISVIFFICFSAFAEHSAIDLLKSQWYAGSVQPTSTTDFQSKITDFTTLSNDLTVSQIAKKPIVCTVIDLSSVPAGMLTISFSDHAFASASIDGEKLATTLQHEMSSSNYEYSGNNKSILLALELNPEFNADSSALNTILKNLRITSLSGIYIFQVTTSKDSFFGCPMLSIHIQNALDKDTDGKLYGRILNPQNQEIISQNNNCAFSRSGIETVIDVIFPEIKTPLKGSYPVEVELVDKEKNEEVIDSFSAILDFN
ncbi:MAG TPA: hypothetical protein PKH79_02885 [Prolixibacteraceae bacterium]|nr:hypothetical protein [Prolixibacteraceae bacterium]